MFCKVIICALNSEYPLIDAVETATVGLQMDTMDGARVPRVNKRQAVPLSGREDGRVDRPVQTAAVWAPKVLRLDGDCLVCDANEPHIKKHGTGLLDEFIGLADAEASEYLRFGKKWGALNVAAAPRPRGLESTEPIQAWRALARRARALYRIGAELSFERTGNIEDWAALGVTDVTEINKSLTEARCGVMTQIRKLITEAHLQPRLHWNPSEKGQWQIDLDAAQGRSNLLAVLTIQLMIRIADKEGFAICAICHSSYVPRRSPTPTKRNYCDRADCQRKKWAYLKREQRRRKQDGNEKKKRAETKTRKQ